MPTAAQQTTHALKLPYILPAQALRYITHNEALRALDVRVQTCVQSRSLANPPASPELGQTFIVPDPQGSWSSPPGTVTRYEDGAYLDYPPHAGWLVWLVDEEIYLQYDGVDWRPLDAGQVDLSAITELGINTSPDRTNRFAVASDAVLFSHNGGSHRCVVNKAASTETASFLFQNDFTGHAEFGLIGNNHFALKMSGDGIAFEPVFSVDPLTSHVRLPDGRKLEFKIDSGGKSGVSFLHVRSGNLTFEKPTSDDTLADGTAFVFSECGGRQAGNPFWQGLQLTSTIVTHNSVNSLPRASLYWRFSAQDDPDDLSFVLQAIAPNLDADITLTPAGQGAIIADTSTGLHVGPDAQTPQAMLDIQGAIRLKAYTVATLPNGQGQGTIAMVSDTASGLALVYFDGADWRTVHDRLTL